MNETPTELSTAEWPTPQDFFDKLNARFQFTLDPCATHENAKCQWYYTKEDDGLKQSWAGHRVFMNPPWSRKHGELIDQWVEKARLEAENGTLVVGLLPARIDTQWWHNHVQGHADVRFKAGRLKFGEAKNGAKFPSAVAIWWGWPVLGGDFTHG